VEQEFDTIWKQVANELQSSGKTFETEGTTEEAARADYRKIAERRVRLGLVMAEIGERNNIDVTEEELQRALSAQMRQFPRQEQALVDYYRKNPEALGALRAPIFEQKVADFVLELATVTDKTVTRDELMHDEDEDRIV
jgi:trigger factor